MSMSNWSIEKVIYVVLIVILLIVAIIVPIAIIQGSDPLLRSIHLGNAKEVGGYFKKYPDGPELTKYTKKFVKGHSLYYQMNTIGETRDFNNPITRITLNGNKPESLIVIVGGILSNDHRSVLVALHLMNEFVADCECFARLLNKHNVDIIPVLNPDGYHFTESLPIRANLVKNYHYKESDQNYTSANLFYNFNVNWTDSEDDYDDSNDFPGSQPYSEVEAALFKDYVMKYKDEIKLMFLLFSPLSQHNDTKKQYLNFPEMYKDDQNQFLAEVLKGVSDEVNGSFEYIPSTQLNEPSSGRMDRWLVEISQPDPIPVINIQAHFRKDPNENTQETILQLGSNITVIVEKIIQLVDSQP